MKKSVYKILLPLSTLAILFASCVLSSKDSTTQTTEDTTKTLKEQIEANMVTSGLARNVTVKGNIANTDCDIYLKATDATFEAYGKTEVSRVAVMRQAENRGNLICKGSFFYSEVAQVENGDTGELFFEVKEKINASGNMEALEVAEYYEAPVSLSDVNNEALQLAENSEETNFGDLIVEEKIATEVIEKDIYESAKKDANDYVKDLMDRYTSTILVTLPESVGECPFEIRKTFYSDEYGNYSFTYEGLGNFSIKEYYRGLKEPADVEKLFKCSWNTETKRLSCALVKYQGRTYEEWYKLFTNKDSFYEQIENEINNTRNKIKENKAQYLQSFIKEGLVDSSVKEIRDDELDIYVILFYKSYLTLMGEEVSETPTLKEIKELLVQLVYENSVPKWMLDPFKEIYYYDYSIDKGVTLTAVLPESVTIDYLLNLKEHKLTFEPETTDEYYLGFSFGKLSYTKVDEGWTKSYDVEKLENNILKASTDDTEKDRFPSTISVKYAISGKGDKTVLTLTELEIDEEVPETPKTYECKFVPDTKKFIKSIDML